MITGDQKGMFSLKWEIEAPHLAAPHSSWTEPRGIADGTAFLTGLSERTGSPHAGTREEVPFPGVHSNTFATCRMPGQRAEDAR